MSLILGSPKQESKISEMGELAHNLVPEKEAKIYKGYIRRAVDIALEKSGYATWEEVAARPPEARSRFFNQMLDEVGVLFKKTGMDVAKVSLILDSLRKLNRKYLTN